MSPPKRGRLYYVRLDKRRPALVISHDVRNQYASDVLVIPCSTVLTDAPTHVRLRRGEGGVKATTILKCEQITNLIKGDIDAEALGPPLPPARLREVEMAVLRAIGIPVPG
jgi:mRNA interferase MazF